MKATVESEKHEWMRTQALVVFEKGIRALSDEEVQKMSLEWLRKVPMTEYINAVQDRSSALFGEMNRLLSPADHINLVLLLLPEAVKCRESMYTLCWAFYDNAKLLTDVDIRQLTHKRVAGTESLCTGVLNMDESREE